MKYGLYIDRESTYDDTVFPDVNVGTNLSRVYYAVLLYEHMISNVQGEESHPVEKKANMLYSVFTL